MWLNGRRYMELLKWRIEEDLYQEVDLVMETEEQPSDEDHPAPIAGYFVGPTLPSKEADATNHIHTWFTCFWDSSTEATAEVEAVAIIEDTEEVTAEETADETS